LELDSKIYVAGHKGLVGSAIERSLRLSGYKNLILKARSEFNLADNQSVDDFFSTERPDYVFMAAAKVGGILANNTYPADFIYSNLAIQTNILTAAHRTKVKRVLFLGSSCIYPRMCPQPIREEYLLTGPLEPTNSAYAVAKIAGIEMCRAFNRQFGAKFLAAMPTNLYGPGDNYDVQNSHVLPALIRKIHEAKKNKDKKIILWGTGTPRREFLFSDDLADACVYLMNLPENQFSQLLNDKVAPAVINIGCGDDLTIKALAETLMKTIGYNGDIEFDPSMPDGPPRKLLDVSKLHALGWHHKTLLSEGVNIAYSDFVARVIL
jgi:GDP-L-fucose synthase